jgi:hypothetical protein
MFRISRSLPTALALAAAFALSACGSSGSGSGAGASAPAATKKAGVSLAGVCPNPIVIQTDWFPEPEHGAVYQLIGPGGTIDKDKGSYSGPLLDTGVNLEIRAGGPFLGNETVSAQMYKDKSIFMGYVSTDAAALFSAKLPTVAVVTPLEKSPQILMWDPTQFGFTSFADIAKSDAKVLYFQGATYMNFLIGKGYVRKEQLDASYDGSPTRFVTEKKIVQQGFASNEPYKYEHDIRQWMKPVKFLLIHDAGYKIYPEALAVRPDTPAASGACLKKLVPLIQRAQVDYMTDPTPVNDELLKIVKRFASFWTLSEAGNADAVKKMRDLEIVSNGSNTTLGDFDPARVDQLLTDALPVWRKANAQGIKPDLTGKDLYTNEFIDPSIGLKQ